MKSGSRIGPYEIAESIGTGGMGQVYNATDTRLQRPVAIKICSERFSERFEREARTIAALNHPHICTLYDIGPDFLVMEKIDGVTVGEKLKTGPLPIDDAVLYGSQIADALAEAHAHGIIHRDLKPSNIMIARHGIKVLDFGLAKTVSSAHEALTQTGVIMGTPAYMAPEQVLGKDTSKADLFSFGLILYEMLTAQLPVPGASLGLMLTTRTQPIPPPSKIRPDIPAELDTLVCGLLAPKPEDRPQSAEAVRDQLRSLNRAGGPPMPRRWLVPAAIVLLLLILAVIAGAWWKRDSGGAASWKLVRLTKVTPVPGDKRDPAYSKDGAIAFSWSGAMGDRPGIYMIPKIGAVPIQLTESQTEDVSPRWSPDGKQIAFLRMHPRTGIHELFLITVDSAATATAATHERKIRDIKQNELLSRNLRPLLTWTPDGTAIAIPIYDAEAARVSLFRVALDGTSRRMIPSRSGIGDTTPSYSADGTQLAFTNLDGSNAGQLCVVAIGKDGMPAGEPRSVPGGTGSITSPTWFPDGTRMLFTRRSQLMEWKPRSAAQEIYVVGDSYQSMSVMWNADRTPQILFANEGHPPVLQTLKFNAQAHKAETAPALFLKLSGATGNPAFSPNGKWIVFSSDADGENGVWIAEADGRNPRLLARISAASGTSWSHDSRHVAFHSRQGRSPIAQIYVIDVDDAGMAGEPRQISYSSFGLLGARWSADDKYIYTSGTRGAVGLVVRVPSTGGDVEEVLPGGSNPIISVDAKHLLYGRPDQQGLFERLLDGNVATNPDRLLFEDWRGPAGYVPAEGGVLYVGRDSAGNPSAIRYFDYSLHRSFDISPPSVSLVPVMTLSPDGRTLVYETRTAEVGDLTLMQFTSR